MKRLPVTIALIIYGICAMSGAESLDSLTAAPGGGFAISITPL